jgi:hypothetical protein
LFWTIPSAYKAAAGGIALINMLGVFAVLVSPHWPVGSFCLDL